MIRPFIAKCKECGDIEINEPYTDSDGAMIVPVASVPTLKEFKELWGEITGELVDDELKPEKKMMYMTHLNIEEFSDEAIKIHQLEPIECWTDNP